MIIEHIWCNGFELLPFRQDHTALRVFQAVFNVLCITNLDGIPDKTVAGIGYCLGVIGHKVRLVRVKVVCDPFPFQGPVQFLPGYGNHVRGLLFIDFFHGFKQLRFYAACSGKGDQGFHILWETGPPVPASRVEECRIDPSVSAHPFDHLVDVYTFNRLRNPGHFIDIRNIHG